MIDLQKEADRRGIKLSHAGISQFQYPIELLVDDQPQLCPATFSCSTALEAGQRGAHMSRFIELIAQCQPHATFSLDSLTLWHDKLLSCQSASQGELSLETQIFLPKLAPVSRKTSLLNYDLRLCIAGTQKQRTITITLKVACTSCCPCSKAISAFGAHNQRSQITSSFELIGQTPKDFFKRLITSIESAASCELYPLIKREDEKSVTEKAFNNAKFAEDIVRDSAVNLKEFLGIIDNVTIRAENFESIHNHNAFAQCTLSVK